MMKVEYLFVYLCHYYDYSHQNHQLGNTKSCINIFLSNLVQLSKHCEQVFIIDDSDLNILIKMISILFFKICIFSPSTFLAGDDILIRVKIATIEYFIQLLR